MHEVNLSRRHMCASLLAGGALLALRPAFAAGPRVVSFYGDQRVALPARIERVATTWEAQNSIIAMLGYGDRIVATTRIVHDMPVFRRFVPSIAKAGIAGSSGSEINIEELMTLRPDVLFVAGKLPPERRSQIEQAGIAVVVLHDNSLTALVERTLITGEILGPDALRKAQDYRDYFAHNVTRVREAVARIPANQRVKLYHALGEPLSTSGRPSLNQDWMDLGGAINVAEHWIPGGGYGTGKVSLEQIVAADPEAIVAMRGVDAEAIRHDVRWQNVRAVRDGRVYVNPRGMFWWCRETSEEALQFLWLAKTLYPDALPGVDMNKETADFYHRFYGYKLSDSEVDEFLHPRS